MANRIELIRNAVIFSQFKQNHTVIGSALFSGFQWFDVGVIPNSDTKMEIICENNINLTTFVAGCRIAYGNTMFSLANNYTYNQGWLFQMGSSVKDAKNVIPSLTVLDRVELYLSKEGSTLNGVDTSFVFPSLTSSLSIYIGACNQNGAPEGRNFRGLIYKFRIWDGDTLIRDCVPVVLSSGEVVFYDKINQKYYHNQGTGEIEEGNKSLWNYPASVYMRNNGDFVLEYENELYPEWSYNESTGDVVLTYDETSPPDIKIDNQGNIVITEGV